MLSRGGVGWLRVTILDGTRRTGLVDYDTSLSGFSLEKKGHGSFRSSTLCLFSLFLPSSLSVAGVSDTAFEVTAHRTIFAEEILSVSFSF